LVHAYLKLNSFQGRSGFGTWLLSIAKRAIAEYYRSNHAATIIEQYRGTRGSIVRDNALRSYGEAMEESCDIRQQIEDRLACVITVLSLEEQLAVILCDFYGFTDNESSTIMAKSLGAFKHLLHRARVMMDLRCDCNRVLIRKSNLSKRTLCGDARCNLPVTFVTHSEAASQGNGAKLSNSFLLSLRAELLREIDSLIHSDPSRSFGRWPLHVSPKPISKIVPRRHPTFEKR
jgi:DNA-directed RNA polymerase specialized sigma24 family protein